MIVGAAALTFAALGCTDSPNSDAREPIRRPHELGAPGLSRHPIPENRAWRDYVTDGSGQGYVYPRNVYVQNGSASEVDNPQALTGPGKGATTIHSTGKGAPQLVLDLGYDVGGKIEVGITRTDGAQVDLAYSEARQYLNPQTGDGAVEYSGTDSGSSNTRTDTISASTAERWTSTGVRGAERWILLQLNGAGTVTIDYVRVDVTHYRPTVSDYVGHFLSSDSLLNKVWYGAAYTFALDSFRDLSVPGSQLVVVDGGKRDRLVYEGDLGVSSLTGMTALRLGPQIVHHSIAAFGCQQYSTGEMPSSSNVAATCPNDEPGPANKTPVQPDVGSYTAWWVIDAYQYYLYTGDTVLLRKLMPALRRAIGYLESNAQALHIGIGADPTLYYTDPWDLNWHPFDQTTGDDAYTNAAFHLALLDMAQLERWAGDGAVAANADEDEADKVRQAMMSYLWDPAVDAFRNNTADPNDNHTEDAQVLSVLSGVVTGTQAQDALNYITAHLETKYGPETGESPNDPWMSQYVSPYIASWELLARFQLGDGPSALSLIRGLYGHMATTDPTPTMWEKLGTDGNPIGGTPAEGDSTLNPLGAGATSLAHAWSTGPVPALNLYVLGIQPESPGFATWQVAPQPVDLRWAQGQTPTPDGPIVSRWVRGAGDRWFKLTVAAPRATRGTVVVPTLGHDRTIAMDGRVVWRTGRAVSRVAASQQAGGVAFSGLSGEHTFAWGAAASPGCPRATRALSKRTRIC